jgi:predicted ATP-grasp superfamily ATP-dependent carboligase
MDYIDSYHPALHNLEQGNNYVVAKIIVSMQNILLTEQGAWAPRHYSGIVEVRVKFDDEGSYSILEIDNSDGEFYEYDYLADFKFEGIIPSKADVKVLNSAVEFKVERVIYGGA